MGQERIWPKYIVRNLREKKNKYKQNKKPSAKVRWATLEMGRIWQSPEFKNKQWCTCLGQVLSPACTVRKDWIWSSESTWPQSTSSYLSCLHSHYTWELTLLRNTARISSKMTGLQILLPRLLHSTQPSAPTSVLLSCLFSFLGTFQNQKSNSCRLRDTHCLREAPWSTAWVHSFC